MIVPHGVLFWGGNDGKIRKKIIEDDIIEAIIGLPGKLLYGSDVPSALLVINKDKDESRKEKVMFISATEDYIEDKPKVKLSGEHVDKIVNQFVEYTDLERYARVVDMDEIKENDFVLNITRYVDTLESEEEIDLEEAVREWRGAMKERDESTKVVEGYLEELGIE